MRTKKDKRERQVYLQPSINVFQGLTTGESLLGSSLEGRDDYNNGGEGWSQGGLGERENYGNGGDPFSQGSDGKAYVCDWGEVSFTDYTWF